VSPGGYNKNFEVVENGGWHFSWLKTVENIILKLDSYVHKEFNNELFNKEEYISDCIRNKINFLDPQEKLKVKNINLNFPKYVLNNQNLFSTWIEKI
jgi:beta-1,4-mannosyl-glycoprotein beta-1,4-N-acetylglucosaminyltransferase